MRSPLSSTRFRTACSSSQACPRGYTGSAETAVSAAHRYRGALATGIDEVLESYRAVILGLEQDLLSGATQSHQLVTTTTLLISQPLLWRL